MTRWIALLAIAAIALGACSSGTRDGPDRELLISAAASLTDAFGDLGSAFEGSNPGVTVTFNFGPSDGLATQIQEGAPVDVFASASPAWMDAVEDHGPGVTGRADFARNELTVIVPRDDPAGIASLEDLGRQDVRLVIAAEGVPAGEYAREILADAGIAGHALANVVSNAEDVRGVVMAVASGEADAGIVYVTDVTPVVEDRLTTIQIPREVNAIATYPIAAVNGSDDPELARRFVNFVLGEGQETLRDHGFLPAD